MKSPRAILLSVLVLASLVFVACGGGTGPEAPSSQGGSGAPPERLSPELLDLELDDVELSGALSDIGEILNSLDPGLLDLSELDLDETLIDLSILPDEGAAVDLGFDQVDLGQ